MEAPVEQVLRSPKAKLYLDEIDSALCRERQARERFRSQTSELVKSEFINGNVIVHSPAKSRHLDATVRLTLLLKTYTQVTGGGSVKSEKALIEMSRNDYEPDVCYWRPERAAAIQPDQMLFPPPDLIAEVLSPSAEAADRGVKFEDYAAHGVSEYWLIDPDAESLEQYVLQGGAYKLVRKSTDGAVASSLIKGLEIPVRAIFDDAENLAVLRRILALG